MKKLILLIALTIISLPQLSFAEDEVIWETEKIGGLNKVQVSPLGKLLYNTKDSIIQVRNIDDGKLVEEITFTNTTRLDHISITADGRYMAVSGQTKYVIIYDLQARREIKRLTTIANERIEYGEKVVYMTTQWLSSSISPDGKKITGIAAWGGEMENFVVIDIATEKVLFEQRRMGYDVFNPSAQSMHWKSAEYSPDGNYIVSQLEFRSGSDSVYIYNAKNLEIYDVVLNSYDENNKFSFSHFKSLFTTGDGKRLLLYNFENKELNIIDLEGNARNIVFSRDKDKIALQIGTTAPVIMDYQLRKVLDTISYIGLPQISTKANNLIYFGINHNIALIKPDWDNITAVSILGNNNNHISPNPSTGLLNVTLTNKLPSFFRFEVISDSGQKVLSDDIGFLQPNQNNLAIDIVTIPIGHYILRIFSDLEEFTFNIIKEG